MSKRLPLIFLLTAILLVLLTLSFAQDVPFHAEVIPQTARMRWGPGTTFAVQHYANAGHVLLVLEVDADSDEPWTWYYARTPSGVQSWIRSDLVRRSDAVPMEQRVSNPTGIYPVRENNLCNTDLFRACQQGTDFQLWEAGYWAKDRYDTWERDGRNLNVVFYLNPCRTDSARVCTTREQWDAGLTETVNLALTLTPEATQTPFVITATGPAPGRLEIFPHPAGAQLLERTAAAFGITSLYTPPDAIRNAEDNASGTYLGRFQFVRERVDRVTCRYWHRAGVADEDDAIGPGATSVDLGKLRDEDGTALDTPPTAADDPIHNSRLYCRGGNVDEADVVAREWRITATRRFTGRGRISGVTWRLNVIIGVDDPEECSGQTCLHDALPTGVFAYIAPSRRNDGVETVLSALPALPDGMSATGATCTLTKQTRGNSIDYKHTCTNTATTNVRSTLNFNYTYNTGGGFLQPTITPTP